MPSPKIILAAALIAFLPLAACSRRAADGGDAAAPEGGVAFADASFDEALSRARSERRLLLVDVYTDWCGWCKKLDREVFGDPRVAEAARELVAVRVNAEKGGEKVADRYDVQGYPTVLFLDGSGTVVKKVEGYVDVDEMIKILSSLPST